MNNIKNEIDNLLRHWYITKKTREYEQEYSRNKYEKEIYYKNVFCRENEDDFEYKILWQFVDGDFAKAKQELPIFLERYDKAMKKYEKLVEKVSDLERLINAYGYYYFDRKDYDTIEKKLIKKRNEIRYQGILIDTIKQDLIDRFKGDSGSTKNISDIFVNRNSNKEL